jgi:hypothetical protein
MLYGRREERARIAALLDGVGRRHGGVLALAVLTMLLWPASAATSTTIHAWCSILPRRPGRRATSASLARTDPCATGCSPEVNAAADTASSSYSSA